MGGLFSSHEPAQSLCYDPTSPAAIQGAGGMIQGGNVTYSLLFKDQKWLTGCRDCENENYVKSYFNYKKSSISRRLEMKVKYIGEILEDMVQKYIQDSKKHKKSGIESDLPMVLQARFKAMTEVVLKAGDLQKDWQRILYPTADAFHHIADVFGPKKMKHIDVSNLGRKMEAAMDLFGQFIDKHGEEFSSNDDGKMYTAKKVSGDIAKIFKLMSLDLELLNNSLDQHDVEEVQGQLTQFAELLEKLEMSSQYPEGDRPPKKKAVKKEKEDSKKTKKSKDDKSKDTKDKKKSATPKKKKTQKKDTTKKQMLMLI